MSNKIKDIDIKSHTYSFLDDTNNIKNFVPNKIKIDGLLHWIRDDQRFEICKNE